MLRTAPLNPRKTGGGSGRCLPLVLHSSCAALEKTVERAFENLRSREESRKARQEVRRVASNLGTLNKIGVALSRRLDDGAIPGYICPYPKQKGNLS
jgi:hypothetical protein